MYRELVEHPDFVPKDLRGGIDFRRWHDRGRIWRVRTKEAGRHEGSTARRPRLSQASVRDLVPLLGHPVGWWRDTAQRLLVERRDTSAVPLLKDLLRHAADPLARLHALWTLSGLAALDASDLARAARDDDAVREHALRAVRADRALAKAVSTDVVASLAQDPSRRVRLQAALLLGDRARGDPPAMRGLVGLATRDASDPWMRLAILGGLGETALPFLREWVAARPDLLGSPSSEQARLIEEAAGIVGVRRKDDELASFLELVGPGGRGGESRPPSLIGRLALLSGLGAGLDRSGLSLHAWLASPPVRSKAEASRLASLWPAARALALSGEPAERRRIGLEALVHGRPDEAGEIIPTLLGRTQPAAVQSAATRAVGKVGRPELAARAIESWDELALGTRRELLGTMTAMPALAAALVGALERQMIAPVELDPASRDALLRVSDPAVRKCVEALLARAAPADRSTVIARYQPSLSLAGDPRRGAELFAKNCQTCHQHQGQGHKVGPDLSGIAGRPPSVLLSDILDPNRDVAPDFVALTVATERGQVVSGLLAEETASSLKLRKAEGVEETLLRSEIAELRSSGRSLMPEGIEQTLSPQEMADLLAFLRSPSQAGSR
jgi:putative heme-binding domain-containing protein